MNAGKRESAADSNHITHAGNAPLSTYRSLLDRYTKEAETLATQLAWFSFLRLLFFCGFIFLGFKALQTGDRLLILGTIAALAIFLLFIRLYDQLQRKANFYKELV